MALLATQSVGYAGVTPSLAAAAGGGDTFTPAPNLFLEVNNAGGGSITVTVVTPQTSRGQAIADLSVSVTNGQRRFIRISPAEFFADATTGLGNITYSGVTSVTVGVFQVQDA
jgi:hypothetical protein